MEVCGEVAISDPRSKPGGVKRGDRSCVRNGVRCRQVTYGRHSPRQASFPAWVNPATGRAARKKSMPRAHLAAAAALALTLAGAGKEPTGPHPQANQFRYSGCNLHYEKPEITDANYLRGTLIPFGTRIQILEVRKDSVTFKAAGHPPITLTLRDGARS